MTEKINGYGRTELPGARAGSVKRPAPGTGADNGGREDSARTDEVALTDTAMRLKRIETSLGDLPEIDQARVEALQQRIAAGEYVVDGRDVARKLAQLERQLA
jgi:flagellar biosynthesis anti-sigma factor FlgM